MVDKSLSMKKTLTFLSLMGAMATSAVAGTVAIAPAPVIPENDWKPAIAFEAVCALADQSVNPDLWGGRITFSMYKTSDSNADLTHEINASIAALAGNGTYLGVKMDVDQVPFTLGYNLNYHLADKWTAFAGAKIGFTHFEADVTAGNYKADDSDIGFQWGVTTGLKYELKKNVDVILAYEFSRIYADLGDKMPYPNVNVGYHVLSAGLVFWF